MESTAKDIVTMLEGESSLGLTKGTDLFYSRMNNAPDDVVVVFDTSGAPPILTYQKSTSNYHYPGVSIQVRNTKYNDAYALMQQILEYLHGESNITVGTTLYTIIKAINDPQVLHFDDNDRVIMFVNFEIQRRDVNFLTLHILSPFISLINMV